MFTLISHGVANNRTDIKKPKGQVLAWRKPIGIPAELTSPDDGVTVVLTWRDAEYINIPLARELWDANVRGMIFINADTHIRNIVRWLKYQILSSDYAEWKSLVTISVYSRITDVQPCELTVNVMMPQLINIDEIYQINLHWSKQEDYDGVIIPMPSVEYGLVHVHYVPNRIAYGRLLAYKHVDGQFIATVKIEHQGVTYIERVDRCSARFRKLLDHGLDPLNQSVNIQYTSFVPGMRLSNFTSPILTR